MSAELDLLYENYLDKVDYLEKNKPFGAGIFGMKGGPADDPCGGSGSAEEDLL